MLMIAKKLIKKVIMFQYSYDRYFSKEISDKLIARRKDMIVKLQQISMEKGKFLFEGKWLTPDEVKEYYRSMKKQDRQIFGELLGLFVLMVGLTVFFSLILSLLCY